MRSIVLVGGIVGLCLLSVSAQEHKPPVHAPSTGTCGPLTDQSFSCPKFGFTYKVPFGWVDRTSDMQEESPQAGNNAPGSGSETLLAVFERPPDAPGETINSAVVIASESVASYPGLKTAADYFGPITEIAEQQGFKAEGAPYAFQVGTKQLVRGDFSKPRGKLTMQQSSLVMLDKGNVISFTFVGGSDEELTDLISGLSFVGRAATAKRR